MSDEFRRNLLGPEPMLLPVETEIYQHLALGQEALALVAKHPTSSLLWAVLAEKRGQRDAPFVPTPTPAWATTAASTRCAMICSQWETTRIPIAEPITVM